MGWEKKKEEEATSKPCAKVRKGKERRMGGEEESRRACFANVLCGVNDDE